MILGEMQEQWLQMLESGDYKQICGKLRKKGFREEPERFCAVGLIQEVLNCNGHRVRFQWSACGVGMYGNDSHGLSTKRRRLFGLRLQFLEPIRDCVDLIELNDRGHFNFETIARFVRENPSNVFFKGV